MALARISNPVDGTTALTAALWDTEFDNIYNNALSLISPLTGNLDCNGKTLQNFALQAFAKAGLPAAGTAGRLARVTDDIRGIWMDQGSQWFGLNGEVVNVKEFGAKGDGVTDDTAAIVAAIAALGVNGGIIFFPRGVYIFSSLTISTPVTLQGAGWWNLTSNVFGHANWMNNGLMNGTILRSTAQSGNAITMTAGAAFQYHMRDIALIGPGAGTSTGIAIGAATQATVMNHWSNVIIANFSRGALFTFIEKSTFVSLRFWGNAIGLETGQATNENAFYNNDFQSNTTGLLVKVGTLNTFFGGIFQSNTTGISLFNIVGGAVELIDFYGVWFEANTTDVVFNTTNQQLTNILFEGCIGASAFTFVGGFVVSGLRFIHNHFVSLNLTLPATVDSAFLDGNRFGVLTDNGVGTTVIGDTLGTNLTRFNRMAGISATTTNAKNLRGTITVTGAATTGTMTFGTAEPNAAYFVSVTPVSSTGTPAAGSNRVVQPITKTAASFTITVEAAPGVGNSVTFDWILIR